VRCNPRSFRFRALACSAIASNDRASAEWRSTPSQPTQAHSLLRSVTSELARLDFTSLEQHPTGSTVERARAMAGGHRKKSGSA
jgi:hypothetical protein